MAEEQQIARINRHSEVVDHTARGDDRRGNHIASIEDRRRAVNQQDVDSVTHRVADEWSEFRGRMAASFLEHQPAAECAEPSLGDFPGLVEDALFQSGKSGLDEPHGTGQEGCYPQQRALRGGCRDAALDGLRGCCERDDLDRGDHHPRLDHGKGRQRAEGDRLVNQVQPVEPLAIEDQNTTRPGK